MKNLILIGMPGCGKSTVGVLCAKALGMPFLDTDLVLQSRSGRLLQSLVNELGTEGFLRLEEEVILGIACEGTVLATGGSVALEDRAIAQKKSAAVMENAADQGAEMMITACPLCEYNLKKNTPADGRLPVYYFTELLAEALGGTTGVLYKAYTLFIGRGGRIYNLSLIHI